VSPGAVGQEIGVLVVLVPIILVTLWIWTVRVTRSLRAEQARHPAVAAASAPPATVPKTG